MPLKHFLLALLATFACAVPAKAFNISGSVLDAEGEPLPDATVRILSADSAYIKGGAANAQGLFNFSGFNDGKYIVETSFVGFAKKHTDAAVKGADLKLPPIKMAEESLLLKETTVVAVKTPIKVMEDTIEYNADSYKTQPNAVVEDLLKRLPGVEVGTDGSITANGKSVTKILVDGKEFFSDDPKVASKNLPVDMVDKLQVVDRKSDLARMTGVDDGEEETVINLTVKKGMKNGWFGNAEVGYGTDDRYKGNFMVNRFKDGNQLTFLGNFNNLNDLGFQDGGMRFRRFGGNNGITESQNVGVNFNVGKEEIIRFGGDVMYSHTDRHSNRRQNRQYLLEEDSYYQNSLSDNIDKGHNVRADFRIEWKPDSLNSFDFRPNFSFNQNDSRSDAFSVAQGKNMSLDLGDSDGKSYEFGARFIYNHNFRSRKGRSLSVSGNYRFSNMREHEDSYAYNIFYQFNDSTDIYDQYLDNKQWSNSVNGRITWTEPIGNVANGNFLTIAYNANVRWNNSDKLVYDRPVSFGDDYYDYEVNGEHFRIPVPIVDYDNMQFVDTLSNRFRNTNFRQEIRVGYRKVNAKMNLNAGLSLTPIRSSSNDLINPEKNISRSNWYVSPFARFRYKFSKQSSVQANYQGRPSEPSLSQLQPVADYSNPLDIKIGNPNLATAFTHNINLRQQHFDQDNQRSIMTMLDASFTQNSVVSKTVYDMQTGGRTTTYDNVNGVMSARLMNMFSQPLRNKVFSFNNNVFFSYDRRVGFNATREATLRNVSNSFSIHESFSIAFRPNSLELELRPNYSLETTRNSVASVKSSTTHRFGGNFYGTWYSPVGIVLNTDLNYSALRGYAAGYNEDTWMWNASISYQFLSDKSATIQVKAYDLLQQKKSISRSVTAAYIDNTQYNSLTRYFMISFAYKFNTFGKGNEPSQRRSMRGPGGPGGHGGGRPPRF